MEVRSDQDGVGMQMSQGWKVLDGTRFLPWYLPVNTVLGKQVLDTQSGKNWEKHNFTFKTISYIKHNLRHGGGNNKTFKCIIQDKRFLSMGNYVQLDIVL